MTDLWNVKIIKWNRQQRTLRLLLVRVYPDERLPTIVGFFEMLLTSLVETNFSFPGLGHFGLNQPSDEGLDVQETDFRGSVMRVTPLEACGKNEPAVIRGMEEISMWMPGESTANDETLSKTKHGLQCLYEVEVTKAVLGGLDRVERYRGYEHTTGTASYNERKQGYSLDEIDYTAVVRHTSPYRAPNIFCIPQAVNQGRADAIRASFHERFGTVLYRGILEAIRDGQWTKEDDFDFFIYMMRHISDSIYNGNPNMTTRTAQRAAEEMMMAASEEMTPDLVANDQLSDRAKLLLEHHYEHISLIFVVAEKLQKKYAPQGLVDEFLQHDRAFYNQLQSILDDSGKYQPGKEAEAVSIIKSEWNM